MKNLITKTTLIIAVASLTLFSSCVNLAKRFRSQKTYWVSKKDVGKYVEVQVESFNISETPKATTKPKDLFSLTPQGQAEFIKSLSGKTTTLDDFINSLTTKLPAEDISSLKVRVFPSTISKSIVFSVDRRWVSEGYILDRRILNRIGDRLLNFEVSVNILAGNQIQFNSWDKFVTDWVTVDLGKVASSQQWSATANVSATATGKLTGADKTTFSNTLGTRSGKADISQTENSSSDVLGSEANKGTEISTSFGPNASLNVTDKYETSLNLLLSRMKLSGTLSREKITLRQEGAFGVDLSGNTSVSLDYTFNGEYATPIFVFKVPTYYDKSNVILQAATIPKNKVMWIFPNVATAINGTIQYKYLYRHVRNCGKKHIPEARQRVINFYGEVGHGLPTEKGYNVPLTVELIRTEDFKPATYRVGSGNIGSYQFLSWDNDIINFETANEAAAFLEYLTTLSKLGTPAYGGITPPTIAGLRVMKFQN